MNTIVKPIAAKKAYNVKKHVAPKKTTAKKKGAKK
jgi:hypothetical protein